MNGLCTNLFQLGMYKVCVNITLKSQDKSWLFANVILSKVYHKMNNTMRIKNSTDEIGYYHQI